MAKRFLLVVSNSDVQQLENGEPMLFKGEPVSPKAAALIFALGIPVPKTDEEMEAALEMVEANLSSVKVVHVNAKDLYLTDGESDSKLLVEGYKEVAQYKGQDYLSKVNMKLNLTKLDKRFGKDVNGNNTWLYFSSDLGTFKGGALNETSVQVLKDFGAVCKENFIPLENRVGSDGEAFGYYYDTFEETFTRFDGEEKGFFCPHLVLRGTFYALIEKREDGRYGTKAIALKDAEGKTLKNAKGKVRRARGWGLINSQFHAYWHGSQASYRQSGPSGPNHNMYIG